MNNIWWETYLFYLGFESELKYYLPNLNWVLAIISFCILIILLFFFERKLSKSVSVLSAFYVIISAFYLTFILSVTLYGRLPTSSSSWDTLFITYQKAYIDEPGARSAVFFNIILFFPLGLLISRYNIKLCVCFLFTLPVLIEFIQLITSVGVFEISDIINNFVGGSIGLFFARMIAKLIKHIKEKTKGQSG